MGRVKLRYYAVRKGRGYWLSTPAMEARGSPKSIPCGPDGPDARRLAEAWNKRWDNNRNGAPAARAVLPESLAEAFARFRRTEIWQAKASKTKGIRRA